MATNMAEAEKAVARLKAVSEAVQFDASGEFVAKASCHSRIIYFYEFKNCIAANTLNTRVPSLFNIPVLPEDTGQYYLQAIHNIRSCGI